MNYKEILDRLNQLAITKEIFSGNEDAIDGYLYDREEDDVNKPLITAFLDKNKVLNIDGLGEVKIVEKVGGYSDLQDGAYGMDWYIIRYFVDHDVYIKLSGYYSSYDGIEFSSYDEVRPKEKVIIVYDKV